jgi:hypothetical protein
MKKKNIIDLEILEDFLESGVSRISLVDNPAIEVDWFAFKEEEFVYPSPGEDEDTFLGRCVAVNIDEGRPRDQAVAICYRVWGEHKMSVDTSNLPPYTDQITEDKKEKLEIQEIDVFGYSTKYFYICPGAIGTFTHLTQMEVSNEDRGMIRSAAVLADKIFEIEAGVIEKGNATVNEVKQVVILVDDFKDLMREIDEEVGMTHDVAYMDGHVEKVYSYYTPEQAFAAVEDLQVGNPVSWKTGDQNPRGRIREIIRNGGKTVPGSSFVLQGTPDDPGYIIEIYEKVNGEWKPTGKYAGRKANSILKNVELWRQERQVFASEDEQIVVGPAMIPDMEIPRKDQETGQPYYVKFSKEVIARIAEKFMRELRNDQTNIDHKDNDAGSYVMETWIVEDPTHDKINSKYGFNLPEGTWAVKMRVQDPETWKMIKAGKLNGFSIEGSFMSKEDYEDFMKDRKLFDEIKKVLRAE